MYAKEVNAQSPLRILEESIHGGLGKGNLGVVMARAGVGKTACLVQVGLDDLMRSRNVLHIAIGQSLEHVHAWYDALFDDLAARTSLDDREEMRASIGRHRIIQTYTTGEITAERVEKSLEMLLKHLQFQPRAILVDGFDWTGPHTTIAAELGAFKAYAKRVGSELWITAQTRIADTGRHPTSLTPPCEAFAELIDVAIFLEPHGDHVTVRLLKDHDEAVPPDTHLQLHCDTMRLVAEGESPSTPRLPPSAYTLLSGAAGGAESEFGECAEKWGLHEVNYSFEGHTVTRARGIVNLSDAELKRGDVSFGYLKAHMHRTYPDTPLFRRVLQSIWHQVNTAGEVFVVGTILSDQTVKGGTGWAAELARHWGKRLYVFDQEKHAWFSWSDGAWTKTPPPKITATRFTGTGTRFLSDEGRAAIRDLFERSFKDA
jgi:hypothetical protein